MDQTFMKEKIILPLVLSMALPMIISMAVNSLYNIIDSFFVAKVSENAMTALSLVYPIQNLVNSIAVGFGVGINAVVAFHLGAGEMQNADRATTYGLFLSFIHGLILTVFSIFGIPYFVKMFTTDTDVINLAVMYSTIVFSFSTIVNVGIAFEKIFQAVGRMNVSMISMICGCVANIILDPILIFGLFGMPKLGVAGAAIATVIGQTIAALMALTFNIKKNQDSHLHFKGFRPSSRTIGKILSVGIPSILMASMGSVMTFGMNKILMTFSATAIAVFGSYFKLQSFIFMPVFGLNNGMVPIIAFSYGARKRDRMIKTIKLSIAYAVCIMIIGFAIMQIFPDKLLLMFNASETMLSIGVPALRIISVSFLFAGISIVSLSVFQALGHGVLSMMVSFMRQLIFLLPSAYLLSLTGDINKVWFSFLIAEVISVSLSLLSMRYLYKKVIKNL